MMNIPASAALYLLLGIYIIAAIYIFFTLRYITLTSLSLMTDSNKTKHTVTTVYNQEKHKKPKQPKQENYKHMQKQEAKLSLG